MLTPAELERYQISSKHGFLSPSPPLDHLPEYYEEWEAICSRLPDLIQNRTLTETVTHLPLLSTRWLKSEPEFRRAYVILGFIVNGFLWGSEIIRLPSSLSVPFVTVADHLGIPPYPTIAGQNLWNYNILDPRKPIDDPNNLAAQYTFTGADDESWFYVVVTAVEARGAPIIHLALDAFDRVSADDSAGLTHCLSRIASHISGLSEMLPRMYERNDPHFFYNRIRPFLAGTKGSNQLPNGVFYEDGEGGGTWRQCNGPSAAQTSLWQLVDLALDVRHSPTGTVHSINDLGMKESNALDQDDEFLQQMRQYMPGPHRLFLGHVSNIANIRQYVVSHNQDAGLQAAYNGCLDRLVAFRSKHVQIVSRYIVVQSRLSQRQSTLVENIITDAIKQKEKDGSIRKGETTKAEVGTGGTTPVEFLKQVRDETRANLTHP